ncbi:MAG: energy-coupled thiamine transporter ThiT [Clostridia bacterium]|nr:energy-coupled thiamine transporter ThiT [Clostridia bacterium]
MSTTKKLTTSATFVALATALAVLSNVIPLRFLQGGSVTLASMVPIILISVIIDIKWGILSGIVYGCIQMLLGFYPAPTPTFINMALVVILDYILAFGVLGLAGIIYKLCGKRNYSIALGGLFATFLRYVCHIISGLLIWGVYAEEGQTVLAYSLIYNGGYMVPEMIITTCVLALLTPVLKKHKFI